MAVIRLGSPTGEGFQNIRTQMLVQEGIPVRVKLQGRRGITYEKEWVGYCPFPRVTTHEEWVDLDEAELNLYATFEDYDGKEKA